MFFSSKKNSSNDFFKNSYLLDMKFGDISGDGIIDKICLYGHKQDGIKSNFSDELIIILQNGRSNKVRTIVPKYNWGYNARIFVGDFNKDGVDDIKLSMDSKEKGDFGFHYIYSFKNNICEKIFDFCDYNKSVNNYNVEYKNLYKVEIYNRNIHKSFILDISGKKEEYLSKYYDKNGRLIKAARGKVLRIGKLIPFVSDEKLFRYDVVSFQKIIGELESDNLGYLENILTWQDGKFQTTKISIISYSQR